VLPLLAKVVVFLLRLEQALLAVAVYWSDLLVHLVMLHLALSMSGVGQLSLVTPVLYL
jgi:hypothetical protein